MNFKKEQKLEEIKITVKKKVKSFAYLPPFFTNVLLDLKDHSALSYLETFIRVLTLPVNKAKNDKDFESLEKLKICHEVLIFLWAVIFKPEAIEKSKTRILTSSKMFNDWAKNIHDRNLILEIDQIDQQSVSRNQPSIDDESDTIIHNIQELEKERKKKSFSSRILSEEEIDVDADPEVSIPEKI